MSSSLKFRQTNTFLENETLTPEHPEVLEVGLVTGEYLIWSLVKESYMRRLTLPRLSFTRRGLWSSFTWISLGLHPLIVIDMG